MAIVEVPITKDNGDVNLVRNLMSNIGKRMEEDLLREISRIWEVLADLDKEIQEGMSNRVGSGFYANEASDYAEYLRNKVLNKSLEDLDGIKGNLNTFVSGLIGTEYIADKEKPVRGIIGNAKTMNWEMSELANRVLNPPEPFQPADSVVKSSGGSP